MNTQTSPGALFADCCRDLLTLLFLVPFLHLCRRCVSDTWTLGQERCTKITALYDQKDLPVTGVEPAPKAAQHPDRLWVRSTELSPEVGLGIGISHPIGLKCCTGARMSF